MPEVEEFDTAELARLLHVDEDNEDELANAMFYKSSAEVYLEGAGIQKDYTNSLYKHLVVTLIARAAERPDAMTKFHDITESGLLAMIAQLRMTQKAAVDYVHS